MAKGFTFLELLLVMAIMGLMAAIVFVAVNPAELMARSRDTGRITAIAVLGRAVTSYYTTSNELYPSTADWDQELKNTQAITSFPKGLEYLRNSITFCQTNSRPLVNPSYCYDLDETNGNGAIVYTKLESTKQIIKCGPSDLPYFTYSTVDGKAGVVCLNADPTPWPAGTQTYID